jgi:hypothetical protein
MCMYTGAAFYGLICSHAMNILIFCTLQKIHRARLQNNVQRAQNAKQYIKGYLVPRNKAVADIYISENMREQYNAFGCVE